MQLIFYTLLLIDAETGYRNIFQKKSFLMEL